MRRRAKSAAAWYVIALGLSLGAPAQAEGPPPPAWGPQMLRALQALPNGGQAFLKNTQSARLVARIPNAETARRAGWLPVSEHIAVARTQLDWSAEAHLRAAGLSADWVLPVQVALNELQRPLQLPRLREDWGLTGRGVAVGLVDSGVDLRHPALRAADGSSRVAWYLTFDQEPQGLHPELEEQYGCLESFACAIYSKAEIDAWLFGESELTPPPDWLGHGTHVLSTAAGYDPEFSGVAPEADLYVVQSGGRTGAIGVANVLLGARFLFDRAEEAEQPCVLNVSLSSNFGAHDGRHVLEEGLAEMTESPGRAVVVAAGNSAGVYASDSSEQLEPLGIFTEVLLVPGSTVEIPLFLPEVSADKLAGSLSAWIVFQPAEDQPDAGEKGVALAFGDGRGKRTQFTQRGQLLAGSSVIWEDEDEYEVVLLNEAEEGQLLKMGRHHQVAVLAGEWSSGRRLALLLEGAGTARIWLESGGELRSAGGVLLPRAQVNGTVGIPATHPELISVGAAGHRSRYVDVDGRQQEWSLASAPGERSYFSGAGPTSRGHLKPDLLAPGELVGAALAESADPRVGENFSSQYRGQGGCSDKHASCLLLEDTWAVSSGTSMAAPVVTGAVALLLQRQPQLTQAEIRRLLQAGARPAVGGTARGSWVGAGQLDVVGALLAQDAEVALEGPPPDAQRSWVSWANTWVRPGDSGGLGGLLLLRDAEGQPSRVRKERLRAEVEGGGLQWEEIGVGRVEFRVTAEAGTGGQSLPVRIFYEDRLLWKGSLAVSPGAHLARSGFYALGGSCAWQAPSSRSAHWVLLGAALTVGLLRRRGRAEDA